MNKMLQNVRVNYFGCEHAQMFAFLSMATNMAEMSQILLATEAELYIQELKPNNIQDLGNAK
jgi:hypothetical protein